MKLTRFLVIPLGLATVYAEENRTRAWENGMFKIPDLRDICENFREAHNVSATCVEQLDVVCWNLTLFRTMYSAAARFPFTSLGYNSDTHLGNFDQCLSIHHSQNGSQLFGRYCMLSLYVPQSFDNISSSTIYYRLSVCKPDACSDEDYSNIIVEALDPNFPVFYEDHRCQTVKDYEKSFTAVDIATLSIFGVFLCLIFISTAYDFYINKKQRKVSHPLCTSFSFLSNGSKLLRISSNSTSKEQIETFHGFRVIGMMWIVAGHGMMAWEGAPIENRKKWGNDLHDGWSLQMSSGYILTAPLAVDTFFFMSGFLLTFNYLKDMKKSCAQQVSSVPYMYIYRYLRLTPALLMIYLVVISVFRYLGHGPEWIITDLDAEHCKKNWWPLFLYIQNYYNYNDVCLPQTWYLSTDMQLYLLSPLILIPVSLALRKPSGLQKCMLLLLILNVFCTFLPMAINLRFRKYRNTYGTHSKLTDYLTGMMLAIYMRERIDKPFLHIVKERRRSAANLVAWVIILVGMLSTTVCYQGLEIKDEYVSLHVFYSLMRPAWCTGLSWITYSCYHGYGGFVNWILCRPAFQVMGRLTYCIYLVHQTVVDYYYLNIQTPWYFTDYNAFYLFCGHYIISIIVAFFWTLAFESPFIIIEKHLFGTHNKTVEGKPNNSPHNEGVEKMENTHSQDFIQKGTNEELSVKCANVRQIYKINNDMC